MVYDKHIIWTGKDKIVKQTAFCRTQHRDYTASLKNAVNFFAA
jgi:hypothetical protein